MRLDRHWCVARFSRISSFLPSSLEEFHKSWWLTLRSRTGLKDSHCTIILDSRTRSWDVWEDESLCDIDPLIFRSTTNNMIPWLTISLYKIKLILQSSWKMDNQSLNKIANVLSWSSVETSTCSRESKELKTLWGAKCLKKNCSR